MQLLEMQALHVAAKLLQVAVLTQCTNFLHHHKYRQER
jgi:hypothetical protein